MNDDWVEVEVGGQTCITGDCAGGTGAAVSPSPRVGRARILSGHGAVYLVLSVPLQPLATPARLTPAERLVLALLVRGVANREIARLLGRSPRTVANQLATLYRKFRVGSRRELAVRLGRCE
jgi:DNA-binding CsgD family transcriptional regulator